MRFGAHFTYSEENKQSQPNSEGFENTHRSDCRWKRHLHTKSVRARHHGERRHLQMTTFDGGFKYHGLSLEGEYYLRWLNHFHGPGTQAVPHLFDHGIQTQMSTMIMPKLLQLYLGGSTIIGQHGQPWDSRLGMNLHPFKNRVVRWSRPLSCAPAMLDHVGKKTAIQTVTAN